MLFFDTAVEYVLRIAPFVVLVGVIYLCAQYVRVKKEKKVWGNIWYEGLKFLMVCYFAGLVALVWIPNFLWNALWQQVIYGYYDPGAGHRLMFTGEFNFIPSIYKFLRGELTGGTWVQTMVTGNILMFVPLGFILPLQKRRKRIIDVLKIAISIVLLIEIVQPFVGRSFDVDDILYNLTGTIIGYGIYKLADLMIPDLKRKCIN